MAREATGGDDVHVRRATTISLAAPFRAAVAARGGARGGVAAARRRGGRRPSCATATRPRRSPRELGVEVAPGAGAGKIATAIFEALCEAVARPADLRLRLPDRGVAALQAAAGRPGHRRALRAVHRRLRGGQRLQRAERSGRAAAPLRGAAGRPRSAATPRRTRWTRTTSARSSTACRRPAARASASTGSSCC